MKKAAKQVTVAIVGTLVLLIGIALLVLPGPAFLVIPAGIAILASEFYWARRLQDRTKAKFRAMRDAHRRKCEAKRKMQAAHS